MNMCPAKVEVEVYQGLKEKKDIGQSDQFSLKGFYCCTWLSYCNLIPLQMQKILSVCLYLTAQDE